MPKITGIDLVLFISFDFSKEFFLRLFKQSLNQSLFWAELLLFPYSMASRASLNALSKLRCVIVDRGIYGSIQKPVSYCRMTRQSITLLELVQRCIVYSDNYGLIIYIRSLFIESLPSLALRKQSYSLAFIIPIRNSFIPL